MSYVDLIPALALPDPVLIGANCEISPHGDFEDATTLHGDAILLRPPYSKYSVRLSNSGDGVWLPPMDDLQPGAHVDVWATDIWATSFSPGQTSKTLRRDPVPGSVHAYDAVTKAVVDVDVAGRQATIFGRAGFTYVSYRPILECMVVRATHSGDVTGRAVTWSIDLVERSAS